MLDAITPLAVNQILTKMAGQVDIAQLSSHSLRRGYATCATQAKADLASIMRQARWKNTNTAIGYIDALL